MPTPQTNQRSTERRGFSLIEVNMAVLVVAGGLLTLITLFPAGLRMSVSSVADTRISLFSSDVLNCLRAKAETLDRAVWMGKPEDFWKQLCLDTPVAGYTTGTLTEHPTGSLHEQVLTVMGEISDYFTGDNNDTRLADVPVKYRIRLHRRRSATPGGLIESSLQQYIDFQTWRISIAATDRPDLKLADIDFEQFPLYHLELRYRASP